MHISRGRRSDLASTWGALLGVGNLRRYDVVRFFRKCLGVAFIVQDGAIVTNSIDI